MVRRFIQEETGATAIEYALIAALFTTGIVGSLGLLKGQYDNVYGVVVTKLTSANAP